ncbi:MAG: choice-of-anchor D domain-containing protein [Ignavibacteriae bacterium]|nr:choice-of-anchor D domain-containing protein [Ignavibacteriota bacterium]MCB9215199.1 choice-of-anchor D domain-containing protein [Ignavibacteria bacterium]
MNRSLWLTTVVLLFATLFVPDRLPAQGTISIFNIDTKNFPTVEADIYVRDINGTIQRNLDTSQFSATENGEPTPLLSITCPPPNTIDRLSLILTLDVSGSMDEDLGSGRTKLDVVKEAALDLIRKLPLDRVQCAITAFHGTSFVIHPFSNDTASLIAAVASLPSARNMPGGSTGTDFDAAMTAIGTGALDIGGKAPPARAVILITDGEGVANESDILSRAAAYNVMVHTITISQPATDFMKKLANNTGGLWFDEVNSVEALKEIELTMLQRSLRLYPCHIVWPSKITCSYDKLLSLTYHPINAQGITTYLAPDILKRRLSVVPQSFQFGAVRLGDTIERPFILFGLRDTITIEEVQGIAAEFTIVELEENPTLFPLTVAAGDTIHLTLRYIPQQEKVMRANLQFVTNRCDDPILYCVGGKDPFAPITSNLRLTHPNGGEAFKVGTDTVITWEGIPASRPVRLEYSIDTGVTWHVAADISTSWRQDWNVPNSPSNTCLARVTEIGSGILVGRYEHARRGVTARFTPDGKSVVTLEQSGMVRVWDIQTGKVVSQMTGSPAGRLELSPDGRMAAIGRSGGTVNIIHLESRSVIGSIPYGVAGDGAAEKSLLCFSPDGSRLMTTLHENSLRSPVTHTLMIYNIEEKKIERQVFDGRQFYRHGNFSPDGKLFAIGGEKGIIQVWNSTIDTLLYETVDTNGIVRQLQFSYDSKNLYTYATKDSTGFFLTEWQVKDGIPIHTLTLPTPLYDFDAGITDIATTDSLPVLRSSDDATLLGEFSGHVGKAFFSRLSLDGSTLVTGGDDNYVLVWSVERGKQPSDLSDSLWAIIAPYLEPLDVDFDSVAINYSKDSTLTTYVRNTGTADATVNQIRIGGKNGREFKVIAGDAPFTLDAGEARAVRLRFSPGDTGVRTAEATIVASSGTLKATLRGVGVYPDIVGDTVDFGKRGLNTSNDSAGYALHTGTSRLRVDSIRIAGPNPEQFGVSSFTTPFDLRPGDRLKVPVNFLPTLQGSWWSNVEIYHNGFGSPARVILIGEGIKVNAPLINIPDTLLFATQRCTPREETLHLPIQNRGNADLTIEEITVEGNHPNDFTLLDPLPTKITSGTTDSIMIRFLPSDIGDHSAFARIKTNVPNAEEAVVLLRGRFESVRLELATDEVDFGLLCPGEESAITYSITNTGNLSSHIRIDSRVDQGGDDLQVVSLESFDIAQGETVEGRFYLMPEKTEGEIRGAIIFYDTICGTSQELKFRGVVDGPEIEVDSVPLVCAGTPVQLNARGATRYEWEPSDDLDCSGDITCANPIVRPTQTTTYIVTGYDDNGCSGIDSVTVIVQSEPTVIALRMGRGHRAGPGDSVMLPLTINEATEKLDEVTDLEIVVEYNPKVLKLHTDNLMKWFTGTRLEGWTLLEVKEAPGSIRLHVASPNGISGDSLQPLLQLGGEIFLANVGGTELRGTVRTTAPCTAFTPFAGYVTVDSICGLNQRLIDISFAKYSLSPPYPNPSTGEGITLDFSLGLDGPATVEVINYADGNSRFLLQEDLEAGAYQLNWQPEELPSGTYLIRVSSGEWNQVEWVKIVR